MNQYLIKYKNNVKLVNKSIKTMIVENNFFLNNKILYSLIF